MNKNVEYKRLRDLLREQYSDIKKEKRVKKQIKIDEKYKQFNTNLISHRFLYKK